MIRRTQRGPRPVGLKRSVADDGSKRDAADRWTTSTVQLTGYDPLSLVRSFDDAGRIASQSGAGFSSAGSYTYHATKGLKTAQTLPLLLGGTVSDSYSYASDWNWSCPALMDSSRPSTVGPQVVAAAAASSCGPQGSGDQRIPCCPWTGAVGIRRPLASRAGLW